MITQAEQGSIRTSPGHDTVMAVDPGRTKCGIAVVDSAGVVLYRGIVPTVAMRGAILDVCAQFAPTTILLGNGTGAASIFALVDEVGLAVPLLRVDERFSSEQARTLYIQDHPARGWRKMIPSSLRFPEAAYDAYVAVLLARRWWQSTNAESRSPIDE